MPAAKAALYLELIAAGLRKGSAYLDPDDLSRQFDLPSAVDFALRVRVRPKKARGKLSVELSWPRSEDSRPDQVRSDVTAVP